MPVRVFQPLVEVYLLVEQPRQRLSHWSQALAPLDSAEAPPAATVDAYYDPTSNQAIFGLRYDELALGPERLGFVIEVARLAEIGMIQPAELSEGDRRRFIGERLASCSVHVGDQRKVVSALVELVRRVRSQKTSTSPPAATLEAMGQVAQRARPTVASRPQPRGDTPDPMLLVAKGTRKVSPARGVPRSTRDVAGEHERRPDLARGSVRQATLDRDGRERSDIDGQALDAAAIPMAELKQVISEPISAQVPRTAGPAMARRDDPRRPSPHVIPRPGVHRANTVMLSSLETQRMIEAANHAANQAEARRHADADGDADPDPDLDTEETDATTEPFLPTAPEPPATAMIYARYLRSGRWVPIRIGSLSLKGAALLTGALPRVDDLVDVALSFANHRALVRGTVAKVSTMQEAAQSGATAFHVSFELDDASRRQLTSLLTAARAANVTIKPPPARSTRRYPVEWPIALGTPRGAVRAEALDVSIDGMFVRPVHPLSLDANVTFTAVLDDPLPAVSGRARVVRTITEADARIAGLASGYGLLILEMNDADRNRWCGFLARIEKRASKRVLIGASATRLAELQGGLVAAGYAVTGGTDPGAIAQLASAEARPVDAALIDAAWLAAGNSPAWVEALFSGRNVPCVTMNGDARRARMAIDRLLAVV
jgi:hypothetical protein